MAGGGFFGGMAQGVQAGATLANEWDKIDEEERNNAVRRDALRSSTLDQERARVADDNNNAAAAGAMQARSRIGQPVGGDDSLQEPPGTPQMRPMPTEMPNMDKPKRKRGMARLNELGQQFSGGLKGFKDWASGSTQ